MNKKILIGSIFVILLMLSMPMITVQADKEEIKESVGEPLPIIGTGMLAKIESHGRATVTWGPGKLFFWVHYLGSSAETTIKPLLRTEFTITGTHRIGVTLFFGYKSWGVLGALNEDVSFDGLAIFYETGPI